MDADPWGSAGCTSNTTTRSSPLSIVCATTHYLTITLGGVAPAVVAGYSLCRDRDGPTPATTTRLWWRMLAGSGHAERDSSGPSPPEQAHPPGAQGGPSQDHAHLVATLRLSFRVSFSAPPARSGLVLVDRPWDRAARKTPRSGRGILPGPTAATAIVGANSTLMVSNHALGTGVANADARALGADAGTERTQRPHSDALVVREDRIRQHCRSPSRPAFEAGSRIDGRRSPATARSRSARDGGTRAPRPGHLAHPARPTRHPKTC